MLSQLQGTTNPSDVALQPGQPYGPGCFLCTRFDIEYSKEEVAYIKPKHDIFVKQAGYDKIR